MKLLICIFLILIFFNSFSQQEEFSVQGRVIDNNDNPIPDAYIINPRNMDKYTSRSNGVFDALVLPGDSLIITHVSFFRRMVTVYQLMKNPVIELDADTINILQVDIISNEMTDVDRAAQNIKSIDFDLRPKPGETYTESERMEDLLNTENRVQRTAASAVTYEFSPSEIIGKLLGRIEQRKKSNEFSSTKKKEK